MQLTAQASQGSLFGGDPANAPAQTNNNTPAHMNAAPTPANPAAAIQNAAAALQAIAAGTAAAIQPQIDAIRAEIQTAKDEAAEAARKAAEAAARPAQIVQNTIQIAGREPQTLPAGETLHPQFARALALIQAGAHVYLKGPCGSGKTHLAAQIARSLFGKDARFGSISCNCDTTQADILGRLLPRTNAAGNIAFEFGRSPFVEIYEKGGVYLFDEFDAAGTETAITVNQALANGEFTLPDGTKIKKSPDCVILAAGNTFGDGADQDYTARNALDAATLDRFRYCLVNYDTDMEEKLYLAGLPAEDAEAVRTARDIARRVIDERRIARHFFSMRAVSIYANGLHKIPTQKNGRRTIETAKDILEDFAIPLADEDRRAMLAAV